MYSLSLVISCAVSQIKSKDDNGGVLMKVWRMDYSSPFTPLFITLVLMVCVSVCVTQLTVVMSLVAP